MDNGAISGNVNNVTNNFFNSSASVAEMSQEELLSAFAEQALATGGPGVEATVGAFGNSFAGHVATALIGQIAGRDDIPQGQKDVMIDAVENAVEANEFETTAQAIAATDSIQEMMQEWAEGEIAEAAGEADESTGAGKGEGASGGAGGAGAGNWMVALAKAMARIASHHMEQMIHKQDILGQEQSDNEVTKGQQVNLQNQGLDADENKVSDNAKKLGLEARAMTELTAEIQAHAQMFKMMQETMTTVIKTIGEALNSSVRKQ